MIEFLTSFDPKDTEQKYSDYIKDFPKRMTGETNINILNKTCSFMDDDKCYFEIGTHRGCTLVGAALGLPTKEFYGLDNFAGHNSPEDCFPFATIEDGLKMAIHDFGHDGIGYWKSDYLAFLAGASDLNGKKAEVYFYDGHHAFEHQYFGLKCVDHLLADDAIVFVDDAHDGDETAVWDAINKILEEDSRWSLIKSWHQGEGRSDTPGFGKGTHGSLWCGLAALRFTR